LRIVLIVTNRSIFVKKKIPIRKLQACVAKEVFKKVVESAEKIVNQKKRRKS
jgi:hypothetical protein